MKSKNLDNNNLLRLRILFGASFQGVEILFSLAFDNTKNDANNETAIENIFFPRGKYN